MSTPRKYILQLSFCADYLGINCEVESTTKTNLT